MNSNVVHLRTLKVKRKASMSPKRANFKRIGEKRCAKAIKQIALLENLLSANYEFTSKDVASIYTPVHEALERFRTLGMHRLLENAGK